MTKTQLWNEVEKLMAEHPRLPKEFKKGLENLLKPKTGGGIKFQPITIDGVEYYRCRETGRYWPLDLMILNKEGKTRGSSKLGGTLYRRVRTKLKELNNQLVQKVNENEDFTGITKLIKEIDENKSNEEWLTNPDNGIITEEEYNYMLENSKLPEQS